MNRINVLNFLQDVLSIIFYIKLCKQMKIVYLIFLSFILINATLVAQNDKEVIKQIYNISLNDGQSYEWLEYLSNGIGGRLSGSENAERAVQYTKAELDKLGLDKVWLQPVMVPKWVRGNPEEAHIEMSNGKIIKVNICALGGSVATPTLGLKAEIVEVQGLEDLEKLGRSRLKGKIVFFNRPLDPSLINTFSAYSGAVDQRGNGAREASKYGAVGAIVRSMNLRLDDFPHTGGTRYGDQPINERIPTAAISTNDAEYLSKAFKRR